MNKTWKLLVFDEDLNDWFVYIDSLPWEYNFELLYQFFNLSRRGESVRFEYSSKEYPKFD